MLAYIVRRLLLMIPTLFGIMVLHFLLMHAARRWPVEQLIQKIKGTGVSATEAISGGGSGENLSSRNQGNITGAGGKVYRGSQGLDPPFIKQLAHMYGFDH